MVNEGASHFSSIKCRDETLHKAHRLNRTKR